MGFFKPAQEAEEADEPSDEGGEPTAEEERDEGGEAPPAPVEEPPTAD